LTNIAPPPTLTRSGGCCHGRRRWYAPTSSLSSWANADLSGIDLGPTSKSLTWETYSGLRSQARMIYMRPAVVRVPDTTHIGSIYRKRFIYGNMKTDARKASSPIHRQKNRQETKMSLQENGIFLRSGNKGWIDRESILSVNHQEKSTVI
jgi:hypothetical protein